MSVILGMKTCYPLPWPVIKSPQSGWLYVFSSFPPPPQQLLPLTSKPFELNLKIFGTKNIWVWGNVLDDLSVTLTQGHGCSIDYQKFACLRDKVRTTHRITTKHGSAIALVMVITWLDFGEVLLETLILANFLWKNSDVFNFLWKIRMCFFKAKHYFGHISGIVGPIDVKWKGSVSVGCWVQYVILTFDLTHDLDLGCFKVKFRNSSISGIVGLIDVKWKWNGLIWYWADCMTLPFDHTHDLDPGVEISRSKSEIALSQEWDGGLTWNEKYVSHPFMTMILTSVTMVGWADVPDSDWSDFRRRRAVDISSYSCLDDVVHHLFHT